MNPPVINSTSSVSTTRRKREAERSVNWTVEETQVLLCAWSDERVQKSLAENLRNRHVFKHLSARMSEMGFSRSPHQCRLRVKTLKANYVRAKLQRSVDGPHLCTFKYFAEMDAVLGRRSEGAEAARGFASDERTSGLISESGLHHRLDPLSTNGRADSSSPEQKGGRPTWKLDSEVKLENREDSTDEYDFSDTGFSQQLRDGRQDVPPDSPVHPETQLPHRLAGESSLSTLAGAPPPPVPTPPPAPSSLPPPPPFPYHHVFTSSPGPRPGTGAGAEPSCLEPVLKHLSECFQQLVSEARGLLVQLESQRQEQARWHQELLAQWLQREERRQRDGAEREERRERARMEHEIRVLELLTRLAQQQQQGCRCGGGRTATEAPPSPNHTKDGS